MRETRIVSLAPLRRPGPIAALGFAANDVSHVLRQRGPKDGCKYSV